MESKESSAASPHLPAEENLSHSVGETFFNPPRSQSPAEQQPRLQIKDGEFQRSWGEAGELEFQECGLSPTFSLSAASGGKHDFTESFFSQQSNTEFAPLRQYPDFSVTLEQFHISSQHCTTHSAEWSSLSQHPLAPTVLSEEEPNNSSSPSLPSLSPGNRDEQEELAQPHLSTTDNGQGMLSREGAGIRGRESGTLTHLTDKQVGDAVEDEIFFLSKDVPAQLLLDFLQKEVSMPSSSNSVDSSESLTSMKSSSYLRDEFKNTKVCQTVTDQSMCKGECHQDETSISQQQMKPSDQTRAVISERHNITTRSHRIRSDYSREQSPRASQRHSSPESENKQNVQISSRQDPSEQKPGAEWVHGERDLLFSQSKTGIDGSYLGFLPQSQSTPGVFMAQLKSCAKMKLKQRSLQESDNEYLYQSNTRVTAQTPGSKVDAHLDITHQREEDLLQTSSAVQALPGLNHMEKADAWRAKQATENSLLFDSSDLEGTSCRRTSSDAGSDNMNQILTQQAWTSLGPSATGAANQNACWSSSSAPTGYSSSSGVETVGREPSQMDNRGSAVSTCRSQSNSSPSIVAMSVHKYQQADVPPDKEWTHLDAPHHPDTAVQPSPHMSLGHFSDVSLEGNLTLSSSQGSSVAMKVGASIGTSSVVSLELDNYAPYWTSEQSDPPPPSKPQEPNSDERILLYLRNLGIDPPPSKILTAFVPRGPVAEPELSSTDLCTVKGSAGNQVTRPSEVNSPIKGELSRSSTLSVNPIPVHPDSLGSADPGNQREGRLSPCSQIDEGCRSSMLQSSHHQLDSEEAIIHLENRSDANVSLTLSVGRERLTSSWQPDYPSAQTSSSATTVTNSPALDDTVCSNAGETVSSKSAQRTEPEGCSAAPPDKVPAQLQVLKPSPAASTQQVGSIPVDRGGISEEGKPAPGVPAAQSCASSPDIDDADQEVMSDENSESLLAVRVAKLLQNDSPATVASTTPSVTDQEEEKAQEWIKSKVCGRRSELQDLDVEDRKCIEEIKKELLLTNPVKSRGSTDTDSTASSSLRVTKEVNPARSHGSSIQAYTTSQKGPRQELQRGLCPDLEARVREIAAREGITLLSKKTPTMSTLRSSTPPPLSASPVPPLSPHTHPLHLTELSVTTSESTITKTPALVVDETSNSFQSATCRSASWSKERRDAVGGLCTVSPSLLQDSGGGDRHESAQSVSRHEESFTPTCTVSGVYGTEWAAGSPTAAITVGHGRVTQVHLNLSPKTTDHTSINTVHPTHVDTVSGLPHRDFVVPRDPCSATISPDKGVGWYDRRESVRPRAAVRSDRSTVFKTGVRHVTAGSMQSVPPQHRSQAETSVPKLLPYKPCGSKELFYVPQTQADVSSSEQSDVTMESSHTGSDDAVPPHFSSEVLGNQDPGLDRGVTFRHTEGIYSKRLKMLNSEHRGPSRKNFKVSTRDRGSGLVQVLHHEEAETNPERLKTVHTSVSPAGGGQDVSQLDPQQCSTSLENLWQKFCTQSTTEEPHSTRDRGASLLERLDRLSRLIHQTKAAYRLDVPEDTGRTLSRKEAEWNIRGAEGSFRQRRQIKEAVRPDEDGGRSSSFSHGSSHSRQLSPSGGDETETSSAVSGSMSSVDTARLIQAFCTHHMQHLKRSSSLSKLYNTINKQRDGTERRRRSNKQPPDDVTPSERNSTNESVVPDSASADGVLSRRGPSTSLTANRVIKLVKSVQAGDLEIVENGTQRNTRDVGTTFPSPGETRAFGPVSSFHVIRERRGQKSPAKPHSTQRHRKKKSPSKRYPKAVSWFISVDNLRPETERVSWPEASSAWRPSAAWFEPYSRVCSWKEPHRQRRACKDRNSLSRSEDPDPETNMSSGLARVSLQEALEIRRPEFICRSRERVRRLQVQMEERKLQVDFYRERNVSGGPLRLLQPAGTSLLRRAVPRREMIQRSKRIYENLPEVQRRREEERRKAEYQSYRLNAQIYNKRITNFVLGRRPTWW